MSYLSRIWLNPLRRQGRRLLGDPQAMHAAVLGGLPEQPVSERVLWRLDADEPRRPGLVVLTRSRPCWRHLVEQAGWPSADGPETPQALTRPYAPLLDGLAEGQHFTFRLTANPVQTRRRGQEVGASQVDRDENGARRSARLGHRTVEHQLRWLLERTDRWGFAVPLATSSAAVGEPVHDARIAARVRRSFGRAKGTPPVTLQVVTYEGRLVVADAVALRQAMLDGLGPAKAYGCGLLTLAPLEPKASG